MKKIIIVTLMGILSCISLYAENEEQATEATPIENGLMLHYPDLYIQNSEVYMMTASSSYDQGYKQDRYWKRGRNLRTIGMITTGVGILSSPLWFVLGGKEMEDASNVGEGIASVNHTLAYAALGGAVIIGGIIVWAIGNSNMRHARLSYTGNGVAYNF